MGYLTAIVLTGSFIIVLEILIIVLLIILLGQDKIEVSGIKETITRKPKGLKKTKIVDDAFIMKQER